MKRILLLLLLTVFSQAHSQLQMYKTSTKDLETFKNSTTVFILSDVYDTATYEQILKDAWTVTPYKIVKRKDFDFKNYLDGKHSFAILNGFYRENQKGMTYYNTYISFGFYDVKDKLKELEKYAKMSDKKKEEYNIFIENRTGIAVINLYPNGEMVKALHSGDMEKATTQLWEKESCVDYKPGILRNYFQAISKFIETNTPGGMFKDDCTKEVKNLKKQTLYMPAFSAIEAGIVNTDGSKNEVEAAKLFKEYKYKHEILDDNALSDKIMSGEEFYYFRFTRENSERFVQVINAKTGEIVYKNYHPGGYYLKPEHLEKLKKAIDTGKI